MKSLVLLFSILLIAGCQNEVGPETEPISSGSTLGDRPLSREYCGDLLEGGIFDEERGQYERCKLQGLVD